MAKLSWNWQVLSTHSHFFSFFFFLQKKCVGVGGINFRRQQLPFFPQFLLKRQQIWCDLNGSVKKGEAKQQSLHKQKVESPQMAGH